MAFVELTLISELVLHIASSLFPNMANHRGAVPEWLNSQYIEPILKKYENTENLQVIKVDISPGSTEGDNYACQIFRISAEYKSNNNEKKISLIGKYKAKTKLLDNIDNIIDAFRTEASFFDDMPPLFKMVLNRTEIDILPICYSLDLDNNLIVMEDLFASNYKLQPRGTFLNLKQCSLVMEGLAEMHGASYRALQIKPELRNKYHITLFQKRDDNPFETIINNSLNCISKCVKIYGLPQKLEVEILKLKKKMATDWFEVCDLKEDHLNFLCHGDCWMNNMMFHITEDKIKFLDFQIYNYNCFANDLQYFLFLSADVDVILNNIDYLLETYYKKLHSVAPEIPNLTLERVKKEFAERYYFGFILSIVFRSVMTSDEPPDMEKIMEGEEIPMGFDSETYIKQLPMLMEFFDKIGIF